jgi:site-specific recombinase XerD
MFEELFPGPIALARHRHSPRPEERRQFLDHLKSLGYARNSLRAVACQLLVIVRHVDLSGEHAVDMAVVERIARRWAIDHSRRRSGATTALAARNLRYWATQWLQWLGRLTVPAPIAPPPYQGLLDGFTAYLGEERGLSAASIRSHGWKTKTFLAWYWPHGRAFADVTIQDVDDFLTAKGRATWSRRSVAVAVQALRAFFRYAERARLCRAGIAAAITGPRLYDLETLPSGPTWVEVEAIIASLATDRPADIRRVAALILFATYGFRLGEVAGLTLDDVDWEHDVIRIRRSKRRDVQTYPLSAKAGGALLRYVTEVRPRGPWREVFLTMQAPHRPLSRTGLYHLASRVLCARGLRLRHHGPHALRHACATRLLSQGMPFKDIGDHLGHRSADATAVYAKVDVPSLREVARFDLDGVL